MSAALKKMAKIVVDEYEEARSRSNLDYNKLAFSAVHAASGAVPPTNATTAELRSFTYKRNSQIGSYN